MDETGENQHESNRGKHEREETSPVLHLQDAITGEHVHDRKHNNDDAGHVAEVT